MAHVSVSTGVMGISISFHEPVAWEGWLLYHHESTQVGRGMSYVRGQVFTEGASDRLLHPGRHDPGLCRRPHRHDPTGAGAALSTVDSGMGGPDRSRRRDPGRQARARASRPRAMTSRWISLVPSPMTISGASR